MAAPRASGDGELAAIAAILKALEGLDGESMQRVLDYVFSRLSIAGPAHFPTSSTASPSVVVPSEGPDRQVSIRDLKEGKKPESANQMAAIVAYYLSEVVSEAEHSDTVTTADLEKYFKQAGFKLPQSIAQTLQNATAAGYFESLGSGKYRLNPVGYNLVVHGLPRDHGTATAKRTNKKRR